jgi:leukotriene-A4 hydrolase
VTNLQDIDPDDAFSSIPYEKGQMLLLYLEQNLGGIGAHSNSLFDLL